MIYYFKLTINQRLRGATINWFLMNNSHCLYCAARILHLLFPMCSAPSWIPDEHSVDSLHEYHMKWILINSPGKDSTRERKELNCRMSQWRATLQPLLRLTCFSTSEKEKQCWVYLVGKGGGGGGVTHSWPHARQRQYFIKSASTSQESQSGTLWASVPTLPGFVEYADAIFCQKFQRTAGSAPGRAKPRQTSITLQDAQCGAAQIVRGAEFHSLP